MARSHRGIQAAGCLVHQKPPVQTDVVGRGEPGVIPAKGFDEVLLRPELKPAYRRVRPVGPHDQARAHLRPIGQRRLHSVGGLLQPRNARAESGVGGFGRGLIGHVSQIAAQNLQFADDAVAVERLYRHLGTAAAVRLDPRDAALLEAACPHLIHQAHAFDHTAAGAA